MPLPTPREDETQDDFISRCMGNETAREDFPDEKQRAAVCFDRWRERNSEEKTMTQKFLTIRAHAGEARTEKFRGRDHTVIPVTMLVEGVMQASNAPAPELVLAEEFGKTALAWNGEPVVVNHPEKDGSFVSANSPEVLEAEQIGQLFNTTVKDKTLTTEAWIDMERAEEIGGVTFETAQSAADGNTIEVSTGLFADVEPRQGSFGGRQFEAVQRNIVPDHLALLDASKVGACSIEDGCGTHRAASCSCGTTPCTCNGGTTMPQKNGGGTPPQRTAASADDDSRSTLRTFFDKFFARGNSEDGMSDVDLRQAIQTALDAADEFGFVVAVFREGGTDGAISGSFIFEDFDGFFRRSFSVSSEGSVELGDDRERVRPETNFIAVNSKEGLFTAKDAVEHIGVPRDSWARCANAVLSAHLEDGGEEDEARRIAVIAANSAFDKEETDMSKEEKVNALIANEQTRFTEDNREWLMAMEEADLELLEPAEAATPPAEEDDPEPTPTPDTTPNTEEVSVEAYLEAAPPELREVLNEGLATRSARRETLISVVTANSRNKFSEEQLKAKPLNELEALAELAAEGDYSAAVGSRANATQSDNSNVIPAPPKLFEKQAS